MKEYEREEDIMKGEDSMGRRVIPGCYFTIMSASSLSSCSLQRASVLSLGREDRKEDHAREIQLPTMSHTAAVRLTVHCHFLA